MDSTRRGDKGVRRARDEEREAERRSVVNIEVAGRGRISRGKGDLESDVVVVEVLVVEEGEDLESAERRARKIRKATAGVWSSARMSAASRRIWVPGWREETEVSDGGEER